MGQRTVKQEVLVRSGHRCCICFGLNGDTECKRGQIAHLDHNHGNNDVDNLAFLCLAHHDEYDSRPSQSRGWTPNEVKHYRSLLHEKIDELRSRPQPRTNLYVTNGQPPIISYISDMSHYVLDAIDTNSGQKVDGVGAFPVDAAYITFDMTNPNDYDLRILRLYIDVLKFVDVEVLGVWAGDYGGAMTYREYACDVEPRIGRYDCVLMSKNFDYLKLSHGEMEAFRVLIKALSQGIYRLRLGVEYSVAGETRRIEVDSDVKEFAIYDPVFNEPSYDWSTRENAG